MSYISILAIAEGSPHDAAVVSLTCALAKRHGSMARLVVVVPEVAPIVGPIGSDGGLMSSRVWDAVEETRDRLVEQATAIVVEAAHRNGLTCEAGGSLPRIVILPQALTPQVDLQRELPLADLVIIAPPSARAAGTWNGRLSDIVIAGRASVLIARDSVPPGGQPVAVAWDGSGPAARAVRAAIPLLRDASGVAILQDLDDLDNSPGSAADPERLVRYLTAHGVVGMSVLGVKGAKPGPAILRAAESFKSCLLVAGAYSHAPLTEAVFGGATKTFLDRGEGPHLFLSH